MKISELIESFPGRNKNKIYTLLINAVDAGPFDGGCVIFAQALQMKFGGDIVVLIGHAQSGLTGDVTAQHAALLLNGKLIDAGGSAEPKEFIRRFVKNEMAYAGGYVTDVRPIEPNDLPDAPRSQELAAQVSKLL